MVREREEVNNLFAYGTLMIDEIFQKFTKTPLQKSKGFLKGYECYQLKNRSYPGMIVGKGLVNGIIYHQLAEKDFLSLDAYEGEEYLRIKVLVNTTTTEQIQAWTYIYKDEFKDNLLHQPWSLEWYYQNKK